MELPEGTLLTPTQDFVLVETEDPAKVSSGGVLLGSNKERRPFRGVVVAAGPGREVDGVFRPMEVLVGERVLFVKTSGTDMVSGGRFYRFLRQPDILLALED